MSSKVVRVIEDITKAGIDLVFGVPGSGTSLELIDGLVNRNVVFHTTYSEASAVIMAGTVGRLSGCPGVAVSIKGPGVANMVPGLAVCALDQYPVVGIAEAYEQGIPLSKAHKRIDHIALSSPLAKSCSGIDQDGYGFMRALELAISEIPGPTLLNLADSKINESLNIDELKENRSSTEFHTYLSSSRRPIIIVGSLGVRQNIHKQLKRLTIPIFSTVSAKGVMPEEDAHSAGIYTGAGLELAPETSLLNDTDLVIGLGLRNTEVLVANSFSCPSISFDTVPERFAEGFNFDDYYNFSQFDGVLEHLYDRHWGEELIAATKTKLERQLLGRKFLPATVFSLLKERFQRKIRLVVDTGYFCTIAEHLWKSESDRLYLSSGNGRYMGSAIPMALGACLFECDIPTILVVGDGGIGMYFSELKIAVSNRVPLLILLLSDGGFGSVRTRAIRDSMVQEPLIMDTPSWLSAMKGISIDGVQVKNDSEFSNAIHDWNIMEGPFFVECIFDSDAYQEMVMGLRN